MPSSERFVSIPEGWCHRCHEFRPCRCGDYCPVCMADLPSNVEGEVSCVGCRSRLKPKIKEVR